MVKNLGREHSVATVYEMLLAGGFDRQFDYVYVPMGLGGKRTDAERSLECYGFAFINFCTHEAAQAFRTMPLGAHGKKPLQVMWARVQGARENLREFYQRALERTVAVCDVETCRPWVFDADGPQMRGWAVPFPPFQGG